MSSHETIVWQAYEYEPKQRSREWYFAFYVISGAGVATSILFSNYLFALFIMIAVFTLSMYTIIMYDRRQISP